MVFDFAMPFEKIYRKKNPASAGFSLFWKVIIS